MKIKLSADKEFLCQTPNSSGIWGECEFVVTDDPNFECDHWVVYDVLKKEESAICPKGNTWLFTAEPPIIKSYISNFLSQFDNIVTSHNINGHFNVINHQQALRWMYGMMRTNTVLEGAIAYREFVENYDSLKKLSAPYKDRNMSIIASSKRYCKGHKQRSLFARKLKDYLKDNIDIFGWGVNRIECKREAILPYRYHIVVENCSIPDYWTEKLSDCYLGWAFPIYCGCTNIDKYFPEGSYFSLDISNIDNAVSQVVDFIETHDYEASIPYIAKARRRVLDEHNFFPLFANLARKDFALDKHHIKICPESKFDNVFKKVNRKLSNIVRNLSN